MGFSTDRTGDALTRREWLALAAGAAVAPSWGPSVARGGEGPDQKAPAGRIFAFSQTRKREEFSGTFEIDARSGTWRKVTDEGNAGARVSPDGRTLAYTKPARLSDAKQVGIWLCDTRDPGEPRRIWDVSGRPYWSADGRRLLVTTQPDPKVRNRFQTWLIEADGSRQERTQIPETDWVFDWSGDDRGVLAASCRDEKGTDTSLTYWPVYLQNLDGTDARRLIDSHPPAQPERPERGMSLTRRLSPDGRRVAYTQFERDRREYSLWLVGRDGTGRQCLIPADETSDVFAACWSPDGARLTMIVREFEQDGGKRKATGSSHLEIRDVDGTGRRTFDLPHQGLQVFDWR
jgi:Tol biopolymer transport system component